MIVLLVVGGLQSQLDNQLHFMGFLLGLFYYKKGQFKRRLTSSVSLLISVVLVIFFMRRKPLLDAEDIQTLQDNFGCNSE